MERRNKRERNEKEQQGDSNDNVFPEIHRSVRTSYVQI